MSAHLATLTLAPDRDYVSGQQVVVSMVFTVGGIATDPSDVTLIAQRPGGNAVTYTYSGAQITRDGTGLYHVAITLDLGGVWQFHAKGTGTVVAAVANDLNCQNPFPVPPPPTAPGTPYGGAIAVVNSVGTYAPIAGTLEGDTPQLALDASSPTGFSFVPRRNAIIPDIDYNGNVDARPALLALFKRVRQGAWIHFPDGIIKLVYPNTTDHMFADHTAAPGSDRYVGVLPQGVDVTGSCLGWRQPYTIYNNGYPDSGTLIKIYASPGNAAVAHAGEVFRGGVNTSVQHLMFDYADQTHNPTSMVVGAPGSFTPYGTLLHAVANYHGVEFNHVFCHNAYDFLKWEANGGSVTHLRGFPLYRGVTFPRCGAAPDITDIQFNPVGDYRDQPSVPTWVKANGTASLFDGVEGYTIRGFQIFGYNIARRYYDEDNDGFTGVYGIDNDLDIEACNTIFLVDNAGRTYQPMADIGGIINSGHLVPEVGGYGFDFSDTTVPSNVNNRPKFLFRGTFHSAIAGMARAAWLRAGSYGIFDWDGGGASQVASEVVRNDSANAYWVGRFDSPTGTRRWAGTGPGRDKGGMVR